jgi:hypothetical protein
MYAYIVVSWRVHVLCHDTYVKMQQHSDKHAETDQTTSAGAGLMLVAFVARPDTHVCAGVTVSAQRELFFLPEGANASCLVCADNHSMALLFTKVACMWQPCHAGFLIEGHHDPQ